MRNRFQPRSGCYKCVSCGKRTRDTGVGEASLELCAFCFHEATLENEHYDYGPDDEEHDKKMCPICNPGGYAKAICDNMGCQPPKGQA